MRKSPGPTPSRADERAVAFGSRARAAAAVVALAAWVGVLSGCLAVFGRTGSVGRTLWIMSGYFTNTTGVLIALLFTGFALGLRGLARPSLLAGASLATLLVGVVQRLLLHRIAAPRGWDGLADRMLHLALPVLVPLFWLAFARKGVLRARDPALWALYPLCYLGWALARAARDGRYAYPFIDPATGGWSGVGLHVAAITAGFLLFGRVFVLVDQRLARPSPNPRETRREPGRPDGPV